jgi:hypothetical protein
LAAACIAVGLTLPLHLIIGHARESDGRHGGRREGETRPAVLALPAIGDHAGDPTGDHQDIRPASLLTASRSLLAPLALPASADALRMTAPLAWRGIPWRWRQPPVDALALFQVFLI